jgi:hypothetical protein
MYYLNIGAMKSDTFVDLATASDKDRTTSIEGMALRDIKVIKPEHVKGTEPISFWEETFCVLFFAFGLPGAFFVFPPLLIGIGYSSIGL